MMIYINSSDKLFDSYDPRNYEANDLRAMLLIMMLIRLILRPQEDDDADDDDDDVDGDDDDDDGERNGWVARRSCTETQQVSANQGT